MENSNKYCTQINIPNQFFSPLEKTNSEQINSNYSIELLNKLSDSINNFIKKNKLSIEKNASLFSLFNTHLLNFENLFSSLIKSNLNAGNVDFLFNILDNLKNISASIERNYQTDKKNLFNFYEETCIIYKQIEQKQNKYYNNILMSKSPQNKKNIQNFRLSNQKSNKSLKIKSDSQKKLIKNYSENKEKFTTPFNDCDKCSNVPINSNLINKNKNQCLRNKVICIKSQRNFKKNINHTEVEVPEVQNKEYQNNIFYSENNEEKNQFNDHKKIIGYKKSPLKEKKEYDYFDSQKKINKNISNFKTQENSINNNNVFNKKNIIIKNTNISNQNNNIIKFNNIITSLQKEIMQLKLKNQKLNEKLKLTQSRKLSADFDYSTSFNDSKICDKNNTKESKFNQINSSLIVYKKNLEKEKEKNNEYEKKITALTEQKSELFHFLNNKNNEVLKLQQELLSKSKLIQSMKGNGNVNSTRTSQESLDNKNNYYVNIINSLNFDKNDLLNANRQLNKEIQKLKEELIELKKNNENEDENFLIENLNLKKNLEEYEKSNNELKINYDKEVQKNIILQQQINNLEIENKKFLETLNKTKEEYESKLGKQNEELEGLKQLIFKLQEKREQTEDNFEFYQNKINQLENVNNKLTSYFKEHNISLNDSNKGYLSDKRNNQKSKNKKEDKLNKTFNNSFNDKDIICQLNEAKKEIDTLKNKNKLLVSELETKQIQKNYCETLSEGGSPSNYEEEFDLRMMVTGTKNKNKSEDMNIDYPGIQQIKEKYRELDFHFNSMEEEVKKLLMNCQCTNKNMNYIKELCKMVKFDEDTTNRILGNKVKKGVFSFFS